jgi:hypothetical protein
VPAEEIGFVPNPSPLDRSDEIRGIDGRTIKAQNDFAPTGQANLRAYSRYLGILFYLMFGEVKSEEGNGTTVKDPDGIVIPKKAWKHTFTKRSGASLRTARVTLSYVDKWVQARGVTVPSMAFSLADDGVKAQASLMANFLKRLTVNPEDVVAGDAFSVLPFRRRNLKVTATSLAATVALDSIDFTMEQALEAVKPLGLPSGWPQTTQRANNPDGFLKLGGSLSRRDFDPVDWDALIACSVFGLEFAFQSEQNIPGTEGGSYPYSMWVQTESAQMTGGGPENLKQQARHEAQFDWEAGASEAGKSDFTCVIVNDVKSFTE